MNYEKIVGLFDTREHAEAAKRNLESAGFPEGEMSMVGERTMPASGTALREPGMWHRLFGRDIGQHEATVYGRTVESGGIVLSLRVPESDVPRAMGILNAHNVVDVQDRARQQGLIQQSASSGTASRVTSGATSAASSAQMRTGIGGTAMATEPISSPMAKDQVLRLAEEQLDVGKRLVQQGTTRIRRFVTEKPVEAQVSLHEEHANIIRRAISDPKFTSDIDWSDQTVEVTETAEKPVVSKSSHIAEEVVISKEGKDHVETLRDTVRRQQVEVERQGSDTGTTDKGTDDTKRGR